MAHPDPSEGELFAAYHASRDVELRNKLIERYVGLAVGLARRFENRGVPLDDLVQVAHIGVLKAVERFETDRGTGFATFATPTVLGELKRHFRDKTWTMRVPRGIKDLHLRIAPTVAELHHELGRSPSIAEIANELRCSEDDVLEAMEAGAAYRPSSMDASTHDQDGSSLSDRLASPDADLDRADGRMTVRRLLAQLPERQRTIVYLRYFEDLTQAEIAERVGISQVHVSRLLRQAQEHLRKQV